MEKDNIEYKNNKRTMMKCLIRPCLPNVILQNELKNLELEVNYNRDI